jgi:hypothetical protein
MKTEDSLPCSQEPTTSLSLPLNNPSGLSLQVFQPKFVYISPLSHKATSCPVHLNLLDLIIIIQGDQKVTQSILKYLLMVAIQCNSIGLINTQYHCDYTRTHTGHVML